MSNRSTSKAKARELSRVDLLEQCRVKLLEEKQNLLNGIKALGAALSTQITGDEADMAAAVKQQSTSLIHREKLLLKVTEIDRALQRLETGMFGVCEETEEPIEPERLLAIPWTRLSITGAEIRERQQKKFA